jgi:hypothetical protein
MGLVVVTSLIFRMGGYIAVAIELDAGFGCCCFGSKLSFPIRLPEGATADGTIERAAATPVFVPTTFDLRR